MSADNGIYILETTGPEFRVAELTNIEDIECDKDGNDILLIPDKDQQEEVRIVNARPMFDKCIIYTRYQDALAEAKRIQADIEANGWFTEYGICSIRIPRKF